MAAPSKKRQRAPPPPSPATPTRPPTAASADPSTPSTSARAGGTPAALATVERRIEQRQRDKKALKRHVAATKNETTSRCYGGAQGRFIAFCKGRNEDELVTTEKLSLFLIQESKRIKRGKAGGLVGSHTITLAKSAVMKLYDQQHKDGANSNPKPDMKDGTLGETMDGISRQTHMRNSLSCRDKAKGSIIEAIVSPSDLRKIANAFLPLPGSPAATRPQFLSAHLSHRFAFLTSFAATLRCESTRLLSMSDLACINFEDEGDRGAHILVWSLNEGKTNQFGKIDRTAVMRHTDVEMCAQGSLALILFERYEVRKEPFPSFEKSIVWWHTKLIQPSTAGRAGKGKGKKSWVERKLSALLGDESGEDESGSESESESEAESEVDSDDEEGQAARRRKRVRRSRADRKKRRETPIDYGPLVGDVAGPADEERAKMAQNLRDLRELADELRKQPGIEPISYETQRGAFKAALARTGIRSSRVTHIGRAAAASIVAHLGKDLDAQIRRHGHWNKDAMSNCYVEGFPMGVVRGLAGHKDLYHIARDLIIPSDYLLSLVFPGLDDIIKLHDDPSSSVEHSVTARGTLRALSYLRRVFLQDSVFLREKEGWSHLSALWDHPIFRDPEYLTFAEDLKQACSTPEAMNPAAYRIDSDTREYIDGHFRTLHDDLIIQNHTIATTLISKEDAAALHRNQEMIIRTQHELISAWNAGSVLRPCRTIPELPALASPARVGGSAGGLMSSPGSLARKSAHKMPAD